MYIQRRAEKTFVKYLKRRFTGRYALAGAFGLFACLYLGSPHGFWSPMALCFQSSAVTGVGIPPKTILFKSNQLGERGTEVAIFDYAYFIEKFFHVKSYFVFKILLNMSTQEKFESFFPGRVFVPPDDADKDLRSAFVQQVAKKIQPDAFYSIEAGGEQEESVANITNLIHAVFTCNHRHGDKYVAISDFVYHEGEQCEDVVPHMIWLPDDPVDSLRQELGIPEAAFVFGWYGGHDAWDDTMTPLVLEVAAQRLDENVFFLFRNFKDPSQLRLGENPNILSLPADSDMVAKKRFVLTCDIFLHTRTMGETFGLAIAEFSILQRPIITNRHASHRFHLDTLKEDAYTYGSASELRELLLSLNRTNVMKRDFASHYDAYGPRKVMEAFNKVFFDGTLVPR